MSYQVHKASVVPLFELLLVLLPVGCGVRSYDATPHDQLALIEVATIKTAEAKFYAESHRYGSLSEIGSHRGELSSRNTVDNRHPGYRFSLEINGARYTLRAVPDDHEIGMRRSFYCDQTGIVRQSWGPGIASAQSPEVR